MGPEPSFLSVSGWGPELSHCMDIDAADEYDDEARLKDIDKHKRVHSWTKYV